MSASHALPLGRDDLSRFAQWWEGNACPNDTLTRLNVWGLWQEWACSERNLDLLLMSLSPPQLHAAQRDLFAAMSRIGVRKYRPRRPVNGTRQFRYDLLSLVFTGETIEAEIDREIEERPEPGRVAVAGGLRLAA